VTVTASAFPIVGRDDVCALTTAVVGGIAGAPAAVIIVGAAGMGKTTLLRQAIEAAGDSVRVMHVAGSSPSSLTYTGMVKLLWPIREYAAELPAVLRQPLVELFDDALPPSSERELAAAAVHALLEAAAASTPIVLAIDDVDLFNGGARDLLVEVVAGLVGTRVRAVMTARRRDVLAGIQRAVHTVALAPLSADHSAKLVDLQPQQPDPGVRGEVIRWSRGNPLAIIEFTRACARYDTRSFHGATMTEGGAHHPVFINQLAALPAHTRRLLLYAAAATGYESVDAINVAAGHGGDFSHWEPARAADVVEFTDDRRVVFANALVRAAAYADGDLGVQRAAHLALAGVSELGASLRAWHRAAASPGPDEDIAGELEESAIESHSRGMDLQLARALQRAAELSPRRSDAARRYALAASAANFGGDPAWALSMTDVPFNEADEPDVAGHAALTRASILLQSSRPADAVDAIRQVLDGKRPTDTHLVLALIHAAAGASYYSGDPRHRHDLQRWLAATDGTTVAASPYPVPLPADTADLQRAYVSMYADTADDACARPRIANRRWWGAQTSSMVPARQLVTGVMAYACDETACATTQLSGALEQLRATGGLRGFTFALAPLCWSLLDGGRWIDLQHLLGEAQSMSAVQSLTLVDREINACLAQLLAFRSDLDGAWTALSRARTITPTAAAAPCATSVALARAAGWIAAAAGDFDEAYRRFSAMFTDDGSPVHFVISHRAIADLAWAAARSGREEQVRPLIAAVGQHLGTRPAVRLRLLHHQAVALTTPTQLAERHYKLAVFDPAGEEWPMDRARARLHYGEWLRRNRRPAEARPLLTAALDVFDRLGAETLAEVARAELRAAGVTAPGPSSLDALHALTAQERQIVVLAASGLTNREIADRLKLSPRTIASHLYHVYPKLGVSRRHELRQFTS
jgi:DNA-binding CsgD family transcriptional regulator